MKLIATVFPELTSALAAELRAAGRDNLAHQLETAAIQSVSFDNRANAGYISVKLTRALKGMEQSVADMSDSATIAVTTTYCAYLDVDNSGRLTGVELLSPPGTLKRVMRQWATV